MPEPEPQPTFEQKAVAAFRAMLQESFKQIPELRSVAVVFDWQRNLNEGAVSHLWTNAANKITSNDLETILCMTEQVQKVARSMTAVMVQALAMIHQQAQAPTQRTPDEQTRPLPRFAEPSEEDKAARQHLKDSEHS